MKNKNVKEKSNLSNKYNYKDKKWITKYID